LGIEYLLLNLSVLKQLLDGLLYFNVAPGLPNSTQEKDDINIPGTRAIVIWRLLGHDEPAVDWIAIISSESDNAGIDNKRRLGACFDVYFRVIKKYN